MAGVSMNRRDFISFLTYNLEGCAEFLAGLNPKSIPVVAQGLADRFMSDEMKKYFSTLFYGLGEKRFCLLVSELRNMENHNGSSLADILDAMAIKEVCPN